MAPGTAGLQDWAVLPRESNPKLFVLGCGGCVCVSPACSAGVGFAVTGTGGEGARASCCFQGLWSGE